VRTGISGFVELTRRSTIQCLEALCGLVSGYEGLVSADLKRRSQMFCVLQAVAGSTIQCIETD
jgi:hypothetical protein